MPLRPPAPWPRVGAASGLALLVLSPGIGGCRPKVEGYVKDPWEHPVEGATVIMEGVAEREVSDAEGFFKMPALDSEMNLLAGKDGYIKALTVVAPFAEDEDEDDREPLQLTLYPDPAEPGFYAIGETEYVRLESEEARAIGTELDTFNGVPDIGEALVPSDKPMRVVFSTGLRPHEISRLDLRLHKLRFVDHTVVKGALGDTEATVNLFVADSPVAFDLKGFPTRNDYLIASRDRLDPGYYAFHIEGVLTSHDRALMDHLPRELRVAYPFEVQAPE